jgi:hypothetical protein
MAESNSTAALDELLDGELLYDATTNRGLTNHLPMALVAKAGLGAPPEELTRFANRYRLRLVVSPDVSERLTRDTWTRAVGVPDAYANFVDYFDAAIDREGVEATLRAHVDPLVDGISGAAFHGVIRLTYALDVASPRRVSAGLAYWAANAVALAPLGGASPSTDNPTQLLAQLAQARDWQVPSATTISKEMQWVASQDEFRHAASSLAVDEATPSLLADAALALYATTNDFTALHGVTGLEAISRVRPYIDDLERFDRASFQALAAAYLTIGAPALWSPDRLNEMAGSTTLNPESVERRASLSDDEHVAKIVFTSKRRQTETRNALYGAVAERAVLSDTTSPAQRIEC